jgi:type IV pilus assembly protein PilY1
MKHKRIIVLSAFWSLVAMLVLAANAHAAAIISNGTVALGVKDTGGLNVRHVAGADGVLTNVFGPSFNNSGGSVSSVNGTGVRGLFVNGPEGYESTFPGCTCEGWGAAVASLGITGFDGNGFSNLNSVVSVFGTDGGGNGIATTMATINDGAGAAALKVTHDFKPSASQFLYQVDVTIENVSGRDLGSGDTDLRYTRLMDWDTEPTPFDEFVTIEGHPADNLLNSSDDGFESANPLVVTSSIEDCAPEGANFVDCGPEDHGARFDFGFPALLGIDDPLTEEVDETMRTLTIFYGAAPTESAADLARATVGAEVYSYGQCNVEGDSACSFTDGTPITYIFGFAGVGGTAPPPPTTGVPEPGSLALMAIGLLALARTFGRGRTR